MALGGPMDQVIAERAPHGEVRIKALTGRAAGLGTDPRHNAAGVAAMAVRDRAGQDRVGIDITLEKGVPTGMGLGSVAASVVAAAVATNRVLGGALRRADLLTCCFAAMDGLGGEGLENVAAGLLGGLVAIRRHGGTVTAHRVPLPLGLRCVLALRESGADALGDTAPTATPGELAAFLTACYGDDVGLFGSCIRACTAHVAPMSDAAGSIGVLPVGRGSGRLAWCHGEAAAERVRDLWTTAGDAASTFTAEQPGARVCARNG
jgi:homoserine kinase